MTQPITLTIEQARDLQNTSVEWPGQWAFLLDVPLPQEPNASYDQARLDAGLAMLERGCLIEQIASQLKWRDPPAAAKQLSRAQARKAKLEKQLEAMFRAKYGDKPD